MAKRKSRKSSGRPDIVLDYNNVRADVIGRPHGLTDKQIDSIADRTPAVAQRLAEQRERGELPYRDLPYQDDALEAVLAGARRRKGRYDNVIVLGIGGSALGTIAVNTACNPPLYNLLDDKTRKTPRLLVMDNVDPAWFAGMLDLIDPRRSLFIVISKSGSTAETMTQFLICRDLLQRKIGKRACAENVVAITDPDGGYLRPIADAEGYETFPVPPGVGGRFSVLSPVGLFPLALVGVDVAELLAGAAAMDRRCLTDNLRKNPAFMSGAIQYLYYEKGKPMSVMMPYSQALRDVADWYRQLWAESLGKVRNRGRKRENVGPTPIKALGVTDQHSQVQLYREGPNDKMFTLLGVEDFGRDLDIPEAFGDCEGTAYLGGHTMGELMNAERQATAFALTRSNRPNATITLPAVGAHTVGQLIYMLEVQTSFVGELLGVNTYDQPGVEAGKQATYALMGRKGTADTRKEIRSLKAYKKYTV